MGPLSQQVIMADTTEEEKKMVEMFRLKRLIQNLESARGNGTSMITLIAPPGDQISQLTRLLTDEQGSASNIKSRVNRLSVLSAITSALQRLKQMSSVPENGLALFTGNVVLSDGKEKKVTYVIEPHRPLNTSLYMCDSRFHVDALRDLLSNDDSFGFIIVDGNGVLYGKLTGNHKETLHKFTVELPKKHGRGGQSAVRFARLRMEARHNYVRKVAEHAVQHFITNDRPNVQGSFWQGRPISRTSWQSPTSLTRASSRSSSRPSTSRTEARLGLPRPSSSRQSRWQTSHSSRRRSSSQSTLSTLPSTQTRSPTESRTP